MKKNLPIAIAAALAIAVGVGGFFGGVAYAKSKTSGTNGQRGGAQGTFAAGGGTRRAGPGTNARSVGGGFTTGEILSIDDKSLTVKMPDGGSKIVFFSDKTKVQKTVDAAIADLQKGTNVRVVGTPNDDGSVSAQSVQIVPAGQMQPPSGARQN
ncbi:MAG: DUF5666 domain-containing protein [Patescibacteria group bacterium]